MNRRPGLLAVIAVTLTLTHWARATDDKPAPARPAKPAPPPPAAPPSGGWGQVSGYAPYGLWGVVNLITELNMEPEFTLSGEQKARIREIRAENKRTMEQWQAEHADEFKGFQEQMMAIKVNDAAGQQKWQEITRAQTDLMATAPTDTEAIAQVKGVLTNEQLKRYDGEVERRRLEGERMQREAMERYKKIQPPAKQPVPKGAPTAGAAPASTPENPGRR